MSECPNKANHWCKLHGMSMLKHLEIILSCVMQTLALIIYDRTKFKYWTVPFQLRARAWNFWVRTLHPWQIKSWMVSVFQLRSWVGFLQFCLGWPFLDLLLSSVSTDVCHIVCQASAAELSSLVVKDQIWKSAEMCLYAQLKENQVLLKSWWSYKCAKVWLNDLVLNLLGMCPARKAK